MNKTEVKNFAIWARRKLISDITYKAGLLGINESGIIKPLPISTTDIEFFDIGTGKPTEIGIEEIKQRKALVKRIEEKEKTSDYITAYHYVMEEVAYTWFNRLIAIRFMEVNDYLPSRVRVLSSEIEGKSEPDIVTTPFETDIDFSAYEQDRIIQFKDENRLDELFQFMFIKQCNKLNEVLPGLFEKTSDYTELLFYISFTDQDGMISHLINDIKEEYFTEAVEIIGWLYQYYNEERKNEIINIYKGTVSKEDIPAATQLFTTDWVVRYMVDNSLGRYWIERNPQSALTEKLEYYVKSKSNGAKYIDEKILPEELTFFDPCMGSGHILVYAFDVLMEIYREVGYVDRDAARSIVENNIFGLDIDERAYQLAYFAVMMKARSYDRRFFAREITPNVYSMIDYTDNTVTDNEELQYLINAFKDAKQYGSLMNIKSDLDLEGIKEYTRRIEGQLNIETVKLDKMAPIIDIATVLMNKYAVVCTNPPYLNKLNGKLKKYVNTHYKDYSKDLFSAFMYKNFDYCKVNGYSSFMTPFVWMFIKTYEKLREKITSNKSITTLVQMEYSAFEEATVPICAFVLKNGVETDGGLYFKLSSFKGGMDVQNEKVLDAIKSHECSYFYETSKNNFSKIPGSPIAYWVSEQMINVFEKSNSFAGITKKGVLTGNDKEYVRLWFEVSTSKIGMQLKNHEDMLESGKKWFPVTAGGLKRKWYGNYDTVVNLENNGADIRANVKNFRLRETKFYMREAITWTEVSSGIFSCRYVPQGILFGNGGPVSFFENSHLMYHLGLLNSKVAMLALECLAPTINYGPEQISKIPLIIDHMDRVESLVNDNISIAKIDWNSFETSWDFESHPLLDKKYKTIEDSYIQLKMDYETRFEKLKSNEIELNKIFIHLYGLEQEVTSNILDKDITVNKIFDFKSDIPVTMKASKHTITKRELVVSFISYAVGCMFGRFSLEESGVVFAGGEWTGNRYNKFIPVTDNCILITDEEYFNDDILGRLEDFLITVYGEERLQENIDFIATALEVKGSSSKEIIRNYFIKDFIKDHIKIYQKRPIYWLYESGKQNGFKALVYMHRYNKDTTGIIRVDYLHKIQRIYDSEIRRMQDSIDNGSNAREISQAEKRKEKLIKQLKETKEYDEKVAHIALNRIDIDLDDGVKVNYEKVQTGQDGKKLKILAKI